MDAALRGKRNTITAYLDEIQKSIHTVMDADALDHIVAKLFPVVTSLRAQTLPVTQEQNAIVPTPFIKTEAFAPAEKNETQLRFHKVKSAGRIKTKFPMKYAILEPY